MHDLRNKAILVTGSTRGIGRAVAAALLAAGGTVGIHGRSPAAVQAACAELAAAGGRALPVPGDLADPQAARTVVQAFASAAGRLDGLVNNAGGGKALAFRGLTLEGWRKTFAINLEAAMVAAQEAYVIMRRQEAGAIVNIASFAGHGPGKWMGADYAAAKAGLVSLTKSLAFEAARFRIRVNAVSPGFVETDMTAALPPETRQSLAIPLGRLAKPEEIASAVLWLLSEDSAYLTGEVLHVDGGLWM
jgi:3-oxoacyl-[acyl-carrier protein] reductase